MSEYSFGSWQTSPYQQVPEPFFHDVLDQRRAMYSSTPQSAYPDGYLGTLTGRKDPLTEKLASMEKGRPYLRGVHKGERIDPRDYQWPTGFNLMTGVIAQAKGEPRFVPTMEQRVIPRGADSMMTMLVDPQRAAKYQSLRPDWR